MNNIPFWWFLLWWFDLIFHHCFLLSFIQSLLPISFLKDALIFLNFGPSSIRTLLQYFHMFLSKSNQDFGFCTQLNRRKPSSSLTDSSIAPQIFRGEMEMIVYFLFHFFLFNLPFDFPLQVLVEVQVECLVFNTWKPWEIYDYVCTVSISRGRLFCV